MKEANAAAAALEEKQAVARRQTLQKILAEGVLLSEAEKDEIRGFFQASSTVLREGGGRREFVLYETTDEGKRITKATVLKLDFQTGKYIKIRRKVKKKVAHNIGHL